MTKKRCVECSIDTTCRNVCDNCLYKNHFIVNNVLAYIATYIKRSSLIQLKLAVLGFFSEKDISSAKDMLYEEINELDLLVSNVTRHNSSTRSAKEAELDDIISVFQKIDGDESVNMPRLLVEDITQLPPAAPESGACVMSLMESMAKMQRDMHQLQDSLGSIRADVMSHGDAIVKIQSTVVSKPTYAGTVSTGPQPAYPSTSQGKPPRSVVSSDIVADAIRKVAGESSSVQIQQPGTGISLAAGVSRPKNQNRGKAGTSGTQGGLKAGPKEFQVQITNVSQEITEKEIQEYISGIDTKITTKSIKDTSTDGWLTKRFLLTFDCSHFDTVMSTSFWPSKIYFKQWFPARPKPKDSSSTLVK